MTTLSFPFYRGATANLPGLHFVVGRIALHSTTPTVSSGKGFTVAKVATGRYKVTLNREVKVIASLGQLAKPTGGDHVLRKPVYHADNEGANIVEWAIEDEAGTLEDAADTDEVEFLIVCMAPATSLPD